ncbi:MFS transporter, FSR family, fosmidomycin resistance protein [Cryobacterium luteum]|uniref:MFS transporter n=2 Tax=Cryobacterium luteum TaxID=1424661 RepID=A0A1H8MHH3_9MICO|nr:MFS transporter [Cryobacterium luteum]SEO16616.1 MFS transporter, FSR family, fosmidomycin resistance protein [Cryobacterium luteum]
MPHVITRPGSISSMWIAMLLALTHAANDALTAVLGALLPTLEVKFSASPILLAVLVAVFSISSSAPQPVLGSVADRVGLRQIAAIGVALAAITLSLIGVAPTVLVLILLLLLGGLGSAALHPISTSIVGGAAAKNPSLAVGLFTAGGMVGFAIGPVLILYLISQFGIQVTPWLMVPGLILAMLVYLLLPDFVPHAIRRTRLRLVKSAFNRQTIFLTLASTLINLAFLTYTSAVPLWLVNEHRIETNAPLLGWTLAAFSIAAALGAVAGGVMAPRIGGITTTVASLLAATAAFLVVLLLPAGGGTLIAGAVAGFMLYASQPLLIVAAQTLNPNAPTAAAGVVIGIGSGLAGLLYIGSGILQGMIGLIPAMQLNFLLLIPAALIATRGLRVLRVGHVPPGGVIHRHRAGQLI